MQLLKFHSAPSTKKKNIEKYVFKKKMIGSSAVTNKSVIAQTKRRREKKMEQNHKKSHREKWKAGGGGVTRDLYGGTRNKYLNSQPPICAMKSESLYPPPTGMPSFIHLKRHPRDYAQPTRRGFAANSVGKTRIDTRRAITSVREGKFSALGQNTRQKRLQCSKFSELQFDEHMFEKQKFR